MKLEVKRRTQLRWVLRKHVGVILMGEERKVCRVTSGGFHHFMEVERRLGF